MSPESNFFRPAAKRRRPARVALDGPTGSGKTYTAMLALDELCGPGNWGVIDTERDSALDYADRFEFAHAPLYPPYSPNRYIERIRAATEAELPGLLIDSLSHAWFAEGGVLDIVDKAKVRSHGNSFVAWGEGTPAQNALIDALLAFPGHLFVTMRSKMEYVVEDVKGKQVPRKIGLAPVQREGVEYEFQVICDMDLAHNLVVSKSRCAELSDVVVSKPDGAWWRTLKGWLDSGAAPAEVATVDEILAMLNSIEDEHDRTISKRVFVDCFGKPADLTVDRSAEAFEWTRERVALLPSERAPEIDGSGEVPLPPAALPDVAENPEPSSTIGEPGNNSGERSEAGDGTDLETGSEPADHASNGHGVAASPITEEVGAPGASASSVKPRCSRCGSTKAGLELVSDPGEPDKWECTIRASCDARAQLAAVGGKVSE